MSYIGIFQFLGRILLFLMLDICKSNVRNDITSGGGNLRDERGEMRDER